MLNIKTTPRRALVSRVANLPQSTRVVAGVIAAVVILAALAGGWPSAQPGPLAPAAGLALALVLPTVLLRYKVDWPVPLVAEAWLMALVTAILGLLVLGLGLNYLLPLVGVDRPLASLPTVLAVALALVALALWRPTRVPNRSGLTAWVRRVGTSPTDLTLVTVSCVALALSVAGAIRLNNAASGLVALIALISWIGLVGWVLFKPDRFSFGTRLVFIFALGLAFLLMTSLRGWFVTGHDIQYEYNVFELTNNLGRWRPGDFRSAYYACLSITILPTMLVQLTGLSGFVVFKIVLQVLFAFCPVILLIICRRAVPDRLAILGVVYFIIFPTFFSDMPFLVRQEMAFLFFAATVMLVRNGTGSRRSRQMWALAMGVGIILTHYSTNYVFLATVFGAWLARLALRPTLSVIARLPLALPPRIATGKPVLGLAVFLPLLVATVVWTGPVSHSGGQFERTFSRVAESLTSAGDQVRSSDTSYSIFSPQEVTPDERFAAFQAQQDADRAEITNDDYLYPREEVSKFAIQRYETPEVAFTTVGRAMDRAGLSPSVFNKVLRSGIASALQVFIVLGIGLLLIGRTLRKRMNVEFLSLGIAAFGVVAAQVVLPALSVDYGVLRAFEQSLILLAPLLALGCVMTCTVVFRRRAYGASVVVLLAFALSLTGVVPQTLGGYPVQLNLNNAGQYYDVYYTHPEEVAAMDWLNTVEAGSVVKSEISSDRYTSARLQNFTGTKPLDGIYPTQLRRKSFVFLGTTTVQNGTVATFFQGDLLTYRYPIQLLDISKSLVYSSGGARIYR